MKINRKQCYKCSAFLLLALIITREYMFGLSAFIILYIPDIFDSKGTE